MCDGRRCCWCSFMVCRGPEGRDFRVGYDAECCDLCKADRVKALAASRRKPLTDGALAVTGAEGIVLPP